jgi:glycerol-3-phosphate O-acyltransferase/dihydroxyacetone phosphate acyltransferase
MITFPQLTHATRRLYLTNIYNSDTKVSLADNVELNRRLLKGYTTYSSTPEVEGFVTRLKKYMESLRALGLKDHQLLSTASIHTHFSTLFLLPKLLYRFFKLAILTLFTLPGLFLFSPVFILTLWISKRKTAEALAGSSVKIRGFDVMATWKILVAGGLAPLFYAFYTLILIALNKHNHVYGLIPARTPASLVVVLCNTILPSITYAALLFGEQGLDLVKSLYPLLLSLSPRSSSIIEELREERTVLAGMVKEMVNIFGADIFPDCDDIKRWKGRGPRSLYAGVSPEAELEEIWGLDEFV